MGSGRTDQLTSRCLDFALDTVRGVCVCVWLGEVALVGNVTLKEYWWNMSKCSYQLFTIKIDSNVHCRYHYHTFIMLFLCHEACIELTGVCHRTRCVQAMRLACSTRPPAVPPGPESWCGSACSSSGRRSLSGTREASCWHASWT